MSTILDALKKSEQERKLNKLPRLTDMQAPQEASRWPLVIAIMLSLVTLLAIALGAYWWLSGTSITASQAPVQTTTAAQGSVPAAAEPEPPGIQEDDVVVNVVSYADEPEQRFAMVNGKMVREGEFVEAGLRVEKITLDSVQMNLRGKQITRTP